jgi:hypothetical protein
MSKLEKNIDEAHEDQEPLPKAGKKTRSVLIFMIAVGMLMATSLWIEASSPILNIAELDKRSGLLEEVFTSGRSKNPYIGMQLENGDRVEFSAFKGLEKKLMPLVGSPLTIWSQPVFRIHLFGDEHMVRQIEHQGELILDYDKVRPRIEAVKKSNKGTLLFVFPFLMIFLPAFILWKNRSKAA